MDVDEVAERLYGLPPEEFIPARTAAAGEARRGGDRPFAAAVATMRRPTVAAWLVNRHVREHPDDVERLLDLGPELAAAMRAGDAAALRRLAVERRSRLGELLRRISRDADRTVTSAVTDEVTSTLEAALADPAAAAAVRRGRLTVALRYAGFGATGAAGVGTPGQGGTGRDDGPTPPRRQPGADRSTGAAARRRTGRAPGGTGAGEKADKAALERAAAEKGALERAVLQATGAADDAQHLFDRRVEDLRGAGEAAVRSAEAVASLRADLAAAQERAATAALAVRRAEKAAAAAERSARSAHAVAAAARQRLDAARRR